MPWWPNHPDHTGSLLGGPMLELQLPTRHDWTVQDKNYGKLTIEAFEPGFALAVGIAYRRGVLSGLHRAAPPRGKIQTVPPAFAHPPGGMSDTPRMMMNRRE